MKQETNYTKEINVVSPAVNREFIVSFYSVDENRSFDKRFRTLKHLSDWFNNNTDTLTIIAISEIPGDSRMDKYFRKGE